MNVLGHLLRLPRRPTGFLGLKETRTVALIAREPLACRYGRFKWQTNFLRPTSKTRFPYRTGTITTVGEGGLGKNLRYSCHTKTTKNAIYSLRSVGGFVAFAVFAAFIPSRQQRLFVAKRTTRIRAPVVR